MIRRPPLLGVGQLHFLLWEARADSSKAREELGDPVHPVARGNRAHRRVDPGERSRVAVSGQKARLAGDVEMPMLGFGTWRIPGGQEAERAVSAALEAGYRHIDTAQAYGNEASVGRALAGAGVSPAEVFVTTKFNPGLRDPVAEAERSLERLGVDRLDLYLVHDPRRERPGPGPGCSGRWRSA